MLKRILTVSVLASAACAALAQSGESSVNLYGIVDAGVTRVSGLKGGTNTQLSSGIMDGTRWGLRGNEEIGGGYRGIFTMESRVEANNGTSYNRPPSASDVPDRYKDAALLGLPVPLQAALQPAVNGVAAVLGQQIGVNHIDKNVFDRQLYVGLVTPFGAVLAGRQYTPAYEVSATFDTMQTQSSLAAGQLASFPPSIDIRVSNALAYRFQKGAVSGSAMYTVEPAGSNTTMWGLNAMYKTDPFSVGFGYNTHKNEKGEKALTSAVLGATVAAGPGAVSVLYAAVKDDHPAGLSGISALLIAPPNNVPANFAALIQSAFIEALKQDARLAHVGYKLSAGPNTFYVAYTMLNDKRPNNADAASYGAVYSYSFSKRTDLNFVLTHFNNKGLSQAAPGGAGYLGGITEKAGTDSNSIALGLRHRF
jgi:predicted porin